MMPYMRIVALFADVAGGRVRRFPRGYRPYPDRKTERPGFALAFASLPPFSAAFLRQEKRPTQSEEKNHVDSSRTDAHFRSGRPHVFTAVLGGDARRCI